MNIEINLPEKNTYLQNIENFSIENPVSDLSTYANTFNVLTPVLSWSAHDDMFKKYLNSISTKKLVIYQTKKIMSSMYFYKVYEYTTPEISNDKVVNLYVSIGAKFTSVNNIKLYTNTEFDNEMTLSTNCIINDKIFLKTHFDLLDMSNIPVVTYFIYNTHLFNFIKFVSDNDLEFLYGFFKEIKKFYFSDNLTTFNRIPIIDAFCFSDVQLLFYNLSFKIVDEEVNNMAEKFYKRFEFSSYKQKVLVDENLPLDQIIELLKNKCDTNNYEEELFRLYEKTDDILYVVLCYYFNKFIADFRYAGETLELYRQFTYKPIVTADDINYNKYINDEYEWQFLWDLTYLCVINYNTTLFDIILNCYIGNNIVNGSEYFKGINVNYYLASTKNPINSTSLEQINSLPLIFKNQAKYDFYFSSLSKPPKFLSHSEVKISTSKDPFLIFNCDDKKSLNLFNKFILHNEGLFNSDFANYFSLESDFLYLVSMVSINAKTAEQAIRYWNVNFYQFYSGRLNGYNFKILESILNSYMNLTNEDRTLFIEHIVVHSFGKNYLDFSFPLDPMRKKNAIEFVFNGKCLNLLTQLMYSNSITKKQAKELLLIDSSLFHEWKEGFEKLVQSLGVPMNDISTLIRDELFNPAQIYISGNNFNYFFDLFISGLKLFTDPSDIKKYLNTRTPFLLEMIINKITYVDDDDEEKLKYLIDKTIEVLFVYNKKLNNKNKPFMSSSDILTFWSRTHGPNGDNLLHLITQTGNTELMRHILITKKTDVKLSFKTLSENARNIFFYIKYVEQLEFVLFYLKRISESGSTLHSVHLADLFYQVDSNGLSVLYTWFNKEASDVYEFLKLVLPELPKPLRYNESTIIDGFSGTLTEYLISNQYDDFKEIVDLLKSYNLINNNIELYSTISKNIEHKNLTEQDIENLKLVLASEKLEELLEMCVKKDYSETINSLFQLDNTNCVLKFYVEHNIIKKNIYAKLEFETFEKEYDGKKVIEHLLSHIYDNTASYHYVAQYFIHLKRTGRVNEINQLELLPGLLEINKSAKYVEINDKIQIQQSFGLAFYLIKNFVSDEAINKIINDKSGKYKPIHVLYGFGRSHKWKNIGGYLNLYYYLYGKTTPMADFEKPEGYDDIDVQIKANDFLENDFDIDLIPDTPADKENIPVLDHYITFPTDTDNLYSYSYEYNHVNNNHFYPRKNFTHLKI